MVLRGTKAPDKGGQQNQLNGFIVSSNVFLSRLFFNTEIVNSVE